MVRILAIVLIDFLTEQGDGISERRANGGLLVFFMCLKNFDSTLPDENMTDVLGHEFIDAILAKLLVNSGIMSQFDVIVRVFQSASRQIATHGSIARFGYEFRMRGISFLRFAVIHGSGNNIPTAIHVSQKSSKTRIPSFS